MHCGRTVATHIPHALVNSDVAIPSEPYLAVLVKFYPDATPLDHRVEAPAPFLHVFIPEIVHRKYMVPHQSFQLNVLGEQLVWRRERRTGRLCGLEGVLYRIVRRKKDGRAEAEVSEYRVLGGGGRQGGARVSLVLSRRQTLGTCCVDRVRTRPVSSMAARKMLNRGSEEIRSMAGWQPVGIMGATGGMSSRGIPVL